MSDASGQGGRGREKFAAVKGMNDLLPPQIETWQFLERTARDMFGTWGYSEVRTPILEDTGLFVRSVGEVTDIVSKEMYTFTDKGDRSVTMRPENTAPAVRAYLEHGFAQQPVTRWYYLGPMFRYERMKTGRYRQFYQLGAEAYGAGDASQDVENIALAHAYLKAIGVQHVTLHLNSLGDAADRPRYLEALKAHFAPHVPGFSEAAKDTFERNTMRLLDSKEEALRPLVEAAPRVGDFLGEAAARHFDEVKALLSTLGIPFVVDPRLVRGLDYYTRTTFEFVYEPPAGDSALGTAGTVCGGGRYDDLVRQLGGPDKPAVGFAMGLDRLVLLLEALGKRPARRPLLFVATMDGALKAEAVKLVTELRLAGLCVDFDPRGGKVKRQIERASALAARYFAVYGEREHQARTLTLKALDLPDGDPGKETQVGLDGLEDWLRRQ
ncbi:MAG: histidine--tRNA ligase [Myxococcaceae bacterium]|nr:histidine--tRNA ligase [Myxococcaceae bacterium]MCA3011297.1 histidine--tRNA ligase [Myxococcaceae bacterium]